MPQKAWVTGEEVLAADFNTYLQNQVVPAFTTTAQRDSQWTTPPAGALCVTVDTNTLWQRVAGAWQKPVSLPQGRLGHATTATDTTVTAVTPTYTQIAGLSVPVTVAANRYIMLRFQVGQAFWNTGTPGLMEFRVAQDGDQATKVAERGFYWWPGTSAGSAMPPAWTGIVTPTAGAHTYTVWCAQAGAGLSVTFYGSNYTNKLIVEDIGGF
jgi:hypothetical protein